MGILYDMMKTKIADNIIFTPENIATDMVNILPDDVWNSKTKFLDPCCKSGIFLKVIYNKLMEKLSDEIEDEVERREHILNNQLYGIGQTQFCTALSQRGLYGTMKNNCNIKYIDGYIGIVKDTDVKYKSTIERVFGADMKFDVVIGNPPYNNDLYLDFVQSGYNLLKDKGIMNMITPAKWQAKGGKKNEDFREKIVPRMKEIVYYPYTQDVFDVTAVGGITYYSVYKECQEKCTVSIKKNSKEVFYEEEKFDIAKGDKRHSYYNSKIEHIINKCAYGTRLSKTIFIDGHKNGKYMVKMSHLADDKKKSSCIGGFILTPIYIEEFGDAGQNKFILYRGTKEQCESFKSYVYTKFVRFMVAIGMCASSVRNTETWRFVPNPDAFDHIFTDDELYKKYNLTQDEIDIIESVIKERK